MEKDPTFLSLLDQAISESVPSPHPDDKDYDTISIKVPNPEGMLILSDYLEERGKDSWARAARWMGREKRGPRHLETVGAWWFHYSEDYHPGNQVPRWVEFPPDKFTVREAVLQLFLCWEESEKRDRKGYHQ